MSQFDTLDPVREARRANVARDLASFYAEMASPEKKQERFSIARLITAMAENKLQGTYEGGVCRAAELSQGREWSDTRSQIVPFGALLSRDLTASTPSAGGNLVGSGPVSAMDILRPFSVVARMGVTLADRLTTDLLLPSIGTAATAQWLPTETSEIVSTNPMIGQVASKPKTAGTIVKASLNFMKQSKFADEVIRQQLLGAIGAALDQAVLAGTGASGQPTGLSLVAGVNAQSGAVTFANMLDSLETLATADADDENIKYLTTPAIRRLLQARDIGSGTGQMIWRNNQLADKPAYVTTDCPAGTIFAGDWSKVMVALWGSGIEIVTDPFTNFKLQAIQVRALIHADVIVSKPAAMLRHTSAS